MQTELHNTKGACLKECPINVLNEWVAIKPVPKVKTTTIVLAEQAQVSENCGIVMGCGGDVPNAEAILGKRVIYAKFSHYEPYGFTNKDEKRENYIILDYRALMGEVRDDY